MSELGCRRLIPIYQGLGNTPSYTHTVQMISIINNYYDRGQGEERRFSDYFGAIFGSILEGVDKIIHGKQHPNLLDLMSSLVKGGHLISW